MAEQSLYFGRPIPKRFYGSFSSTAGDLFIQHGVSVETASHVYELQKTDTYPILDAHGGEAGGSSGFGVTYKSGTDHLLRFEAGCTVAGLRSLRRVVILTLSTTA